MKEMTRKATGVTRRTIVTAMAGAPVVLAAPWLSRKARAQESQLTIPSYGGNFNKALERAIYNPFIEETGIKIVFSGVPDLARAKAQVTSGAVEWDVMQASGAWGPAGELQGLWEKIDTDVVDMSRNRIRASDYYLTCRMSVGGFAWHRAAHKDEDAPQDFAQFWDAETFPGRRTFQKRIDYVLDVALVADGVNPKDVYPLDIERGFRSLDKIKPHVVKWADTSTQLTQLLQTGEVDFGWNYIDAVRQSNKAGIDLAFSLKQVRIQGEHWCVLRGTKNKDAAMKFLAFSMREDVQIALANELTSIPGIPISNDKFSEEVRNRIPDPSDPNYLISDSLWWADRFDDMQRRFNEWLLT